MPKGAIMSIESLFESLLTCVVPTIADASQDHAQDIMVGITTLIVSAFVSWLTATLTIKNDDKRAIREANIRLIEFAIEYPFLESDRFCKQWPNVEASDDDRMRYENYCCHVFNMIQDAWELTKGDPTKLKAVLYPEELIERHRNWWQGDPTNQEGYPVEYRRFIAEILRKLDAGKPQV